MENLFEKTCGPREGGDVVQLPVPMSLSAVDNLFKSKTDKDGLPRVRFSRCERNHGIVWSQWLPVLKTLLVHAVPVTFYPGETSFKAETGCPYGCR